MALAHVTAIRNALADLVVDAIDAGTANPQGEIQIGTAAFAIVLSTIAFDTPPAFSAATGGTSTMNNPPKEDSSATGGGSAVVFRTRDRDVAEVFQGSVGLVASGEDMELSSVLINAGDAVRINSFTYTSSP